MKSAPARARHSSGTTAGAAVVAIEAPPPPAAAEEHASAPASDAFEEEGYEEVAARLLDHMDDLELISSDALQTDLHGGMWGNPTDDPARVADVLKAIFPKGGWSEPELLQ